MQQRAFNHFSCVFFFNDNLFLCLQMNFVFVGFGWKISSVSCVVTRISCVCALFLLPILFRFLLLLTSFIWVLFLVSLSLVTSGILFCTSSSTCILNSRSPYFSACFTLHTHTPCNVLSPYFSLVNCSPSPPLAATAAAAQTVPSCWCHWFFCFVLFCLMIQIMLFNISCGVIPSVQPTNK